MRNSSSVRHRGWSLAALTLCCAAVPGLVKAQEAPAHIAYADSSASVDRENETANETIDAVAGEPLVPGDRLRTGSGRAEVWLPDGSTLDLDSDSTIELPSPTLIRLTSGRAILVVTRSLDDGSNGAGPQAYQPEPYQIDTPFASVVTDGPGEYRVSLARVAGDYLELAVVRGSAQLQTDAGSIDLRGGERSEVRPGGAPGAPQAFNAARVDAFGAWAARQRDDRRVRAASSRYLPSNLQMYGGTFDRYGSWDNEPTYGDVWYPNVSPGWRPYSDGFWRPLPTYGWTWAGGGTWGWPTHHYGRWGYGRSRWFWIPERRWAPAWVSWASAADYVSWCPLGFDNRPVFGFSLSAGNTWAGWVVMPRTSFGIRNAYVNRYAIEGRRLPRNIPFALHRDAPIAPPHSRGRADLRSGIRIPAAGPGIAGSRAAQRRDPQFDRARTRNGGIAAGTRGRSPAAGDRGRVYRINPGTIVPNRSGTDRQRAPIATPRAAPRYRDSTAVPFENRNVGPPRQGQEATPRQSPSYRTGRRMATPEPSAPQAVAVPRGQDPGRRYRPQADGRSRTAPAPASAPEARSQPRAERRASAPARESAPRARSAERANPRSEARGSSGGDRQAGAGGHGRRRP